MIKADSTRLDEGAWVRQKGNAIGYQWAGTPTDVDSALRNLPTLLDAFAKTTQTQIIAGTGPEICRQQSVLRSREKIIS